MKKRLGLLTKQEFAAVWKARHDELLKKLQRMEAKRDLQGYRRIWKPKVTVSAHTRAGHYAVVPIKRTK